jgi:hypothetical protein
MTLYTNLGCVSCVRFSPGASCTPSSGSVLEWQRRSLVLEGCHVDRVHLKRHRSAVGTHVLVARKQPNGRNVAFVVLVAVATATCGFVRQLAGRSNFQRCRQVVVAHVPQHERKQIQLDDPQRVGSLEELGLPFSEHQPAVWHDSHHDYAVNATDIFAPVHEFAHRNRTGRHCQTLSSDFAALGGE